MTNFLKTSALSVAALVGVAGAAAPALADSYKDGFDPSYYITQLKYDGVSASAVDQVTDSIFRATVTLPNGHTAFQFFDRDSLQPLQH